MSRAAAAKRKQPLPPIASAMPLGALAVELMEIRRAGGSGGVLFIADSEPRAERLGAILHALDNDCGVMVLPRRDALPCDATTPSREVMGRRASVLRRLAAASAARDRDARVRRGPVRIERDGDVIATIFAYDPGTRAPTAELDGVTLDPASEFITPEPREDTPPAPRHAESLARHHGSLATIFDYMSRARDRRRRRSVPRRCLARPGARTL